MKAKVKQHPCSWEELEKCAAAQLDKSAHILTDEEIIAIKSVQGENRCTHGIEYLTDRIFDAMRNARGAAQEIIPEIADIKAHPLPSLESLEATPPEWTHKKTLGQLSEEIFKQLQTEQVAKAYFKAERLEDFFTTWLLFIEAALELTAKKIAVAQCLGYRKTAAKFKQAIKPLPPTRFTRDKDIRAIARRLAETITPDGFRIALRGAFKVDAEATAEINTFNPAEKPAGKFTRRGRKITPEIAAEHVKLNELIKELRRRAKSHSEDGIRQAYHSISLDAEKAGSKWRNIIGLVSEHTIVRKAAHNVYYKTTITSNQATTYARSQ